MPGQFAQSAWWDATPQRRPNWEHAEDAAGKAMLAAVREANALRAALPALRRGWPKSAPLTSQPALRRFSSTFLILGW